jgi:hypothetical protein
MKMAQSIKLNQFKKELNSLIPKPEDCSPEEIRAAANKIADKYSLKVKVNIKIECTSPPLECKIIIEISF